MKTKLTLLASTAAAALAFTAPAQAAGDFYAGVFGGGNWVNDQSFTAATAPTVSADTLSWATDGDSGFIVGGAVGMSLKQLMGGLRAEVEVAYRENQIDGSWTSNTTAPPGTGGTLDIDHSTFSVLANLWYDVDVGSISPYIGGGLGWADTEIEGTYLGAAGGPFSFSNSGFAWQVGAGINFDVSPNIKLGVGYRYFEGPEVTVGSVNLPLNSATGDVDSENHSAIVSLTFGM
jgi:opacity protein-like surface antigen